MPRPSFPSALPPPNVGGYQRTVAGDVAEFAPDSGATVLRRRSSRVAATYTISYTLTQVEADAFDYFYRHTIGGGALAFDWTDPYDGVVKAVRVQPQSVNITAAGPLNRQLALVLEEVV